MLKLVCQSGLDEADDWPKATSHFDVLAPLLPLKDMLDSSLSLNNPSSLWLLGNYVPIPILTYTNITLEAKTSGMFKSLC